VSADEFTVAREVRRHQTDARALRDATQAHRKRELALEARVAVLEKLVRYLRAENALLVGRGKPEPMPDSCYRDPRTGEATGIRFASWAGGKKRGRPGATFNSMRSGGTGATTSSRSGASPKVQGRAHESS
jgi:hypothetical protein